MAHKTVGVLAAATLPWIVWIAKVDADIGADTDAGVLVHLGAVAPGQRFGTVLMVAIMTSATISG